MYNDPKMLSMYTRSTYIYTSLHIQCMERAFFLHEKGTGEETQHQYLQLAQSLDEFIGKTFNDWVGTVDKELRKHLEQPLMAKCSSRGRYVCM